jgi:hypothetical protein
LAFPKNGFSWAALKPVMTACFELEVFREPMGEGADAADAATADVEDFRMVGGLYILNDRDDAKLYAAFLVEPYLTSISALVEYNLSWSDFPRHSSQQRLIILAEQLRSEQVKQTKAKVDERDSRKKEFVDTVFTLDLLVANDFSVWFYIIQVRRFQIAVEFPPSRPFFPPHLTVFVHDALAGGS